MGKTLVSDLAEQHDMWRALKLKEQAEHEAIANPVVKVFGADPQGRKCKGCKHLYARQFSKRYWKCELRGTPTCGTATDHRVNWPACAKYEPCVA